MHEMSICESIRGIVEDEARSQGFASVQRICLEIGQLAGVEVEALRFGFDVVMRGSVAEQAVLEIVEVPGQAWCMACADHVPVSKRYDACPACGSHQLQVTAGEDMKIREMEVS